MQERIPRGDKAADLQLPFPDHGQDFVEGVVHIDEDTFTTKLAMYSPRAELRTTFSTVALLDTGSMISFIREDIWEKMKEVSVGTQADRGGISGRF